MDDLITHTEITGPGVDKLNLLKDSQGQPPSSGDTTYDRILAVARSLDRVIKVQNYLLDRVRLTSEMPHKEHQMLYKMRQELGKSSETLQVFFFGD